MTYIIHLLGLPGVGKYTIAKEFIKNNDDYILIDNHKINNVLFSVIDKSGKLPSEVFDDINQIYSILFKALVEYGRQDKNLIFTNVLFDTVVDKIFLSNLLDVSEATNRNYFPVNLTCEDKELETRLVNEERVKKQKLTNLEIFNKHIKTQELLNVVHQNEMHLDITKLKPCESHLKILNHLSSIIK